MCVKFLYLHYNSVTSSEQWRAMEESRPALAFHLLKKIMEPKGAGYGIPATRTTQVPPTSSKQQRRGGVEQFFKRVTRKRTGGDGSGATELVLLD